MHDPAHCTHADEPAPAPRPQPWTGGDAEALIEHLLAQYHRALDTEMPRLEAVALRVARVHGERNPFLVQVHAELHALFEELFQHMAKEERVLFPMIRAGHPMVHSGPIAVMRMEHDDAFVALASLRALCGDYVTPPDACHSWTALYRGLESFEQDLREHIRLENDVLFAMLGAPDA